MTDNQNGVTENQGESPVAGTSTPEAIGEEKLFTQSQLETLISERLKRERKNNEALNSVKELLGSLQSRGILSSKAYSGLADELCRRLTPQREGLESAAEAPESTDANADKDEACQGEVTETDHRVQTVTNESFDGGDTEAPDTNAENIEKPFTVSLDELAELRDKFSDPNLENVLCSRAFGLFARGRSGKLASVYSDFRSFADVLGKEEGRRTEENRLASTAFSQYANSAGSDYSSRLTKQQMEIAKKAGMSYREYSEMLDSIPQGLRTRRA